MSNSEIIEWLKKKAETVTMPGARKMYQAAVRALEAQQDTISRQAAIDVVKGIDTHFVKYIQQLPSAQPERIKARWVLAENQRPEDMENDNYLFVCSNCGSTDLHSKRVPVSYCWNCGAEMLREVTEWTM